MKVRCSIGAHATACVRSAIVLLALASPACGPEDPQRRDLWSPDADEHGYTAPTSSTAAANKAAGEQLPLADARDFEDARRGLLASDPQAVVQRDGGGEVWNTGRYDFVDGEAPASVNPSLWRQAKLNGIHGLFEVAPGIHQVRGYDLSNLSLIEGKTGWIVVDPLTSAETARAALALARKHLGDRPVRAVILTHSHVDHFGGVAGVLPEGEAERAALRIVAPAGFMHESTSENILAGAAMTRRATFMFGMSLPRNPRGHVDSGLGKAPARGRVGIARPTDIIDRTPQELVLDGVRFTFQYAPESEAPAELTFYLPDQKAFCGAEVVSRTMHNLYTLRGAKVRDALRWSGYIQEAIDLFGDSEVVFASHHWPTWGNRRVIDYLKRQRDTYKYLHDQTMRLANGGSTPREIAEELELPESLHTWFGNRGYYGTVRHNSKAVYQGYFGWYDGNPANLDPLPPAEEAERYVALAGGAGELRRKAAEAFDAGDYRWSATLLNHLVFAEPQDAEARELLARSYDQLGYRAESGPWRDVYLTGAYELRHGATAPGVSIAGAMDLLMEVPMPRFFESISARINGPDATGSDTTLNFVFTDLEESYVLWLENSVLHHQRRDPDPDADATIKLTQRFFLRLATRQLGLREAIFSDELDVDGSRLELLSFFSLLEPPTEKFPIVTP